MLSVIEIAAGVALGIVVVELGKALLIGVGSFIKSYMGWQG